ncbi:MAG TPA: cytochrome c [Longimicrobiales bacterium]|nr:cytochrome c [Longimicrobiales bacterium]
MNRKHVTRHDLRSRARAPAATLVVALVGLAIIACEGSEAPAAEPSGQEPVRRPAPATPASADSGAPTVEDVARANASEAALQPETVVWTGGDARRGADIFTLHCATCHGTAGEGDGPAAAALNPKPRDFTSGVFYIDGNANAETGEPVDLARVILEGPAAFGGSEGMPPWKGTFSEGQVRDLVAFVFSLSDPAGAR